MSADAYLLVFDALDEDDGRLEELHAQALELGLDCAVEVRDEEELEEALERVDPEIFLLSPVERDEDETPLEVVLELLAAVPAGKLAIADLQLTNREEVQELERAGCDAVIVDGHEVSLLVGRPPPDV
jgi:indole-3-glycerol phosphate synthase